MYRHQPTAVRRSTPGHARAWTVALTAALAVATSLFAADQPPAPVVGAPAEPAPATQNPAVAQATVPIANTNSAPPAEPPAVAPPDPVSPEAAAALSDLRARAVDAIAAALKARESLAIELVIDNQPRLVDLLTVDGKSALHYKQFGKKDALDLTAVTPRLLGDLLLGLVDDELDTAAQMHLDAGLLFSVEGKLLESSTQIDIAVRLDPSLRETAGAQMKLLPKPKPPEVALIDLGAIYRGTGEAGASGEPAPPQGTNQEGRKLGPLPKIAQPILSGTPEADAVIANLQLLPRHHALYDDLRKCKVLPNSDRIIAEIGADEVLNPDYSFNYVIVPPTQPKVEIAIVPANRESDPGPYPVPDNLPIEGWGTKFGDKRVTQLSDYQRTGSGDRHALVVDPAGGRFFETFSTHKLAAGWKAANVANWPMNTIAQRPLKWTSADAAGLPILPTLVRYDELQRGTVEHAMRVCVRRTRKEFLYPASHYAATSDNPNAPAMGQRLRLKASVNIDDFGPQSKAIALALKKYGMIVADNGNYLSISLVMDDRLDDPDVKNLRRLKFRDFEVVQGFGENEGSRSP